MKFHHLARHGQFYGPTATAAHHNLHHQPQPRDLSPIKSHLQQQQQQLATNRTLQAADHHLAHPPHHLLMQQSNALSDDEEDDEDNPMSFYDSFLAEQQRNNPNGNNLGAGEALDSAGAGGFLMDKNKKLFPQKLWELIHNPSIQHCLHWSQDGQRVYLNRNEFETYYLKTPNNQFHTQKAISFVRQMNMYGFRKVDDCYYENDNFRRDQQHLLKNMIRRHPNKGLFVGLDHHQLAAAAAAQQALQVNQQLQQLEHQHKHRAEQALRLNSYLNSHHHHHQQQQQQQQQQQFHNQHQPTNLTQHHNHLQQQQISHLKQHSSPFEQMSSRLAQAAVSQLTQQQQRQIAQQLSGGENNSNPIAEQSISFHQPNAFDQAHNLDTKIENLTKNHHQQPQQQQQQHRQNAQSSSPNSNNNNSSSQPIHQHLTSQHHQPKKSRLLSNFYATNNKNNAVASDLTKQSSDSLVLSQDSMHSTSSVDTQPSQRSSTVDSVGSASGSPQPDSPKQTQLKPTSDQPQQQLNGKTRAPINQEEFNRYLAHSNQLQQQQQQHLLIGQDLTSQSLAAAARQAALHQTLVRSLLQLKQQNHHHSHHHHQDLIASFQQQQQQLHQQQHDSRSLLESLASLSSVGTNSIIDPTSNSPTERTATPPSGSASPTSNEHHQYLIVCDSHKSAANSNQQQHLYDDDENIALDLANKTTNNNREKHYEFGRNGTTESERKMKTEDDAIDIEGNNSEAGDEDKRRHEKQLIAGDDGCVVSGAESPLDGTRKVKKFLEDHKNHHHERPDEEDEQQQQEVDRSTSDKIKRELDELIDVVVDERSPTAATRGYDDEQANSPVRKKFKMSTSLDSMAKSLVAEICDRRGDQLNESALNEAARYTGRFIEVLLEDASMIANSSKNERHDRDGQTKQQPAEELQDNGDDEPRVDSSKNEMIIDSSSLSLALRSIPTRLIGAIEAQMIRCQETVADDNQESKQAGARNVQDD